MNENKFNFWSKWLLLVLIGQSIFGVVIAIFGVQFALPPYSHAINEVFWQSSAMPSVVLEFHNWLFAVLGATMASWGVALIFVVQNAFNEKKRWAWHCIALCLVAWFPLDTIMSAYLGVWPNVIFNVGALFWMAMPLVMTRKYFFRTPG